VFLPVKSIVFRCAKLALSFPVSKRTAVIIGAGPAGLTAALELLRRSDLRVIVLERSEYMGGISRTVEYKGNRIDIGGHRFFSKSDRVMAWWLEILPLAGDADSVITYHRQSRVIAANASAAGDPADADRVMLIRPRKSRIYYLRRFFDYPISLNFETLRGLGLRRAVRIAASYAWSTVHRIRPEETLEQFMINRFGRELYSTFFKAYTEKVWGVPCDQISSEWGAQRIKGLSISKAIRHAARRLFRKRSDRRRKDVRQKDTETSLIEQFLYPKLGPGQLWETVAEKVRDAGGEIITRFSVDRLGTDGNRITAVEGHSETTGEPRVFEADFFFSTMPVQELVESLDAEVPANVREVARGLRYRDFITVGLLLKKLDVRGAKDPTRLDDTWLYIQEPDVQVGRVQIFNNWSRYLVADPSLTWIGLEYFCNRTDSLWRLDDRAMLDLAASELDKIGLISKHDVLDGTVIRMPKTYPAYFGAYARFHEVREYLDGFGNLFLVGRNGMHKYNNQDHSMLTAMEAVDALLAGVTDKSKIWAVNTEAEYHETDPGE
jgi:protoporphyrinogen oxidase